MGTVHIYFTRFASKTQERKADINTNFEKHTETAVFTKRIGSTTYKVSVHFKEDGKQTMSDKILHLIQNQDLASELNCGMMDVPQMSRQSEGSA